MLRLPAAGIKALVCTPPKSYQKSLYFFINQTDFLQSFLENLALGGQTVQSSTRYIDWEADKAIDTSPLTCTHTVETSNPWWRLDLLDSYYISTVVITNRPDCCGDRLDGAEIRIGNSLENNGNNNPRCGVLYGVAMAQSISVSCGDMNGRYVNVIIPGSFKILTLCDVQVYRTKVKGFMRIKFTSSLNMSYPAERNKVLNKMKTTLTAKGLSVFTMTWLKVEPEIKLNDDKSMC
nr:fucolectin-like [Misgurnus anguillicaudatus]